MGNVVGEGVGMALDAVGCPVGKLRRLGLWVLAADRAGRCGRDVLLPKN